MVKRNWKKILDTVEMALVELKAVKTCIKSCSQDEFGDIRQQLDSAISRLDGVVNG